MSQAPEEPTSTPDERVAQLEKDLALALLDLDSTKTANAVLQQRYGALSGQLDSLSARIEALEG